MQLGPTHAQAPVSPSRIGVSSESDAEPAENEYIENEHINAAVCVAVDGKGGPTGSKSAGLNSRLSLGYVGAPPNGVTACNQRRQ